MWHIARWTVKLDRYFLSGHAHAQSDSAFHPIIDRTYGLLMFQIRRKARFAGLSKDFRLYARRVGQIHAVFVMENRWARSLLIDVDVSIGL